MSLLVDTSLVVHGGGALEEAWAVSVVTVGELEAGVLLAKSSSERARRLRRLTTVLGEVPALSLDRRVASSYAELRAASGRIPANDLWIAATALAHGLTLLTRDDRMAGLPLVSARLVT